MKTSPKISNLQIEPTDDGGYSITYDQEKADDKSAKMEAMVSRNERKKYVATSMQELFSKLKTILWKKKLPTAPFYEA